MVGECSEWSEITGAAEVSVSREGGGMTLQILGLGRLLATAPTVIIANHIGPLHTAEVFGYGRAARERHEQR